MATELEVRFIFANHDGVAVTLPATTATKVLDLKLQLMERWPSEIQSCNDVSRIRLVCMGSGMLKDNASLGSKFPIFPDHPTPINVSIRPETAVPRTQTSNPLQTRPANDPAETLIDQASPESSSRRCCCCTIS